MQHRKPSFFVLSTLPFFLVGCQSTDAVLDSYPLASRAMPTQSETRLTIEYAGSLAQGNYVELQVDRNNQRYLVPQNAPEMLIPDLGDEASSEDTVFVTDTQSVVVTPLRTQDSAACAWIELSGTQKITRIAERTWPVGRSGAGLACLGMSSDATRVLVKGFYTRNDEFGFPRLAGHRLEVWARNGEAFEKLREREYEEALSAQLSSDGKTVQLFQDGNLSLWDVDANTVEVVVHDGATMQTVGPNGETFEVVALVGQTTVRMSRNGGHLMFQSTNTSLDSSECGQNPGYKTFVWSRNGNAFRCISAHPDGRNFKLDYADVGSEATRSMDISDDGRFALFSNSYESMGMITPKASKRGLFIYDLVENTISEVFPSIYNSDQIVDDATLSPSMGEQRIYALLAPYRECPSWSDQECPESEPPFVYTAPYTQSAFDSLTDVDNPITLVSSAP